MSRSTWVQNRGRHYLFAYRAITFYGRTFQTASTKIMFVDFPTLLHQSPVLSRYPYDTTHAGLTCRKFRLFPVRSPLLGKSLLLSFPGGTKMFQFPPLSPPCLCVQQGVSACAERLPDSEIFGSKSVCLSPKLIAAYHVLHRLLVPRHPPYALSSLTKKPVALAIFLIAKSTVFSRLFQQTIDFTQQMVSGSNIAQIPLKRNLLLIVVCLAIYNAIVKELYNFAKPTGVEPITSSLNRTGSKIAFFFLPLNWWS